MKSDLKARLADFAKQQGFRGKGALCVALVITDRACSGLPLEPTKLLARSGGQVEGLGKTQVQAILAKHGIARVLAEEGGRTSRGSVGNMRAYVRFLNDLPRPVDCDAIEAFWIARVRDFFAGKPFKFRIDTALSIRAAVRDLLAQAKTRQAETPGSRHEGSMLQHLIGAKLDLVLGEGKIEHHSASESDQAEGRAGDFVMGDVAVHVTTSPGEALFRKCGENLNAGLRPLVITTSTRTAAADALADGANVADRVDILDVEQFLAANLHERALFLAENRVPKTAELIARYNQLIDRYETDPSLRVEISGT